MDKNVLGIKYFHFYGALNSGLKPSSLRNIVLALMKNAPIYGDANVFKWSG